MAKITKTKYNPKDTLKHVDSLINKNDYKIILKVDFSFNDSGFECNNLTIKGNNILNLVNSYSVSWSDCLGIQKYMKETKETIDKNIK